MADLLTTTQAADALGLTVQRIRQLIKADRLAARRVGRDWLINQADLATIDRGRRGWPKGRPRKEMRTMFTSVTDAYRYFCELFGSAEPLWTRDQFQAWTMQKLGRRWDEMEEDDIRAAYDASLAED